MWEIIKKNKIKSAIAFSVMIIWYVLIYGTICAICSFFFLLYLGIYVAGIFIPDNIIAIFFLGILIAFLIVYIQFYCRYSKPYNIQDCNIHKVDKLSNKKLYNIVEEIAIASGTNISPNLYILDSNILNAYACGFSLKNSSIVISKGLIEILTRDELQGVIAHEMSHIINRDTTYLLCSGALLVTAHGFSKFFSCVGYRKHSDNNSLAAILFFIFSLIIILISSISQGIWYLLIMFISRKREYLADACACQYTRYPKGLADALLKIETLIQNNDIYTASLDEKNIDPLIRASFTVPIKSEGDKLTSTHPSTQNRIKILLNMSSADYQAYEKEFMRLTGEKLIPQNVLNNSNETPIRLFNNDEINVANLIACNAESTITDKKQLEIIRENKEIFEENLQKHRQIEDFVRNLSGYIIIDCTCKTKLKIPPSYNSKVIICPHCRKKHFVLNK